MFSKAQLSIGKKICPKADKTIFVGRVKSSNDPYCGKFTLRFFSRSDAIDYIGHPAHAQQNVDPSGLFQLLKSSFRSGRGFERYWGVFINLHIVVAVADGAFDQNLLLHFHMP